VRRRRGALAALGLAAALASTGCVWLAVGAGGYLGYEALKDDRAIPTKLDDATITATVERKLVEDPDVSAWDVDVDTYEGVVTLHGDVPDPEAELRAMRLAESVKGVVAVRSELVIVPEER
jgi:hyperosmotically inducible protein